MVQATDAEVVAVKEDRTLGRSRSMTRKLQERVDAEVAARGVSVAVVAEAVALFTLVTEDAAYATLQTAVKDAIEAYILAYAED